MTQPTVCAVCLTSDRQALTDRAVKCFISQTYGNKSMLIFDTGQQAYELAPWRAARSSGIAIMRTNKLPHDSIGALRNLANVHAPAADILIHCDSDDYSAATRIAEQVEMLIQSKADAVGYNEMLMWNAPRLLARSVYDQERLMLLGEAACDPDAVAQRIPGEAWLYTHGSRNYLIGTSLCYWRRTWEAKPFPDRNTGEDSEWQKGLKTAGCSSLVMVNSDDTLMEPRLIAEIHGANTCLTIEPRSDQWKRVPEWDARLRETMKL